MPEQRNALTELVQRHVGAGKRWSTREFADRAIAPESRWSPSKSLVAKIIKGEGYTVTPDLVSAIAAALGLDRPIVGAAAHLQVIGYVAEELAEGAPAVLIRTLDVEGVEAPKAQAVAERWEREQ